MSIAEIEKRKSRLIAWIEGLSDTNMLSVLEKLKDAESKSDWWLALSETQRQHINEGLKDVENGRIISSADFWNKLKNERGGGFSPVN